jgi:hypothetical protein
MVFDQTVIDHFLQSLLHDTAQRAFDHFVISECFVLISRHACFPASLWFS